MKKSLVVLLIAVLAVSSVFAGITGYVDAKYKVDFDEGSYKYTKPASGDKLKAKLVFEDLIGEKKGEGKAYIDAKASFVWNVDDYKDHDGGRETIDSLGWFEFNIDKATIVGKNWSINLIEPEKLGNFASSTLDFHTWYRHDHMKGSSKKNETTATDYSLTAVKDVTDGFVPVYGYDGTKPLKAADEITFKDDYADYEKKVAYGSSYTYYDSCDDMDGITVNYEGWKLALAANGTFEKNKSKAFMFGLQSKEFELGEFKAQAAAGFTYRNNRGELKDKAGKTTGEYNAKDQWVIGASFKGAYASDKFSASIATDQTIKTNGSLTRKDENVTPTYAGDVLATIDFAPVSATVFFGKGAKSSKGFDKSRSAGHNGIDPAYKYYFSKQGKYKENVIDNLFSFQIGLDLATFDIPVALKFQALNMLADSRIFNVEAKLGFFEDVAITVYGKDLLASVNKVGKKAYYANNWVASMAEASSIDEAEKDIANWLYWKENGNSQKLGVTAAWTASDALTVNGEVFFKLGAETIGAKVGAKYVADMFTASATLDSEFDYKDRGKDDQKHKMQLIAEVASDKLVDGATLSLKYESGNMLDTPAEYDWFVGQQAGSLTAKCRITF